MSGPELVSQVLPEPFLVFQTKHIGDFLMSLPALGLLRRHCRGPIGVVVAPAITELAIRHAWIDDVYTLDRTKGFEHIWKLAKAIKRKGYGTALILDGQTRSAVTAVLSRIKNRLGAPGLYALGNAARLYTHQADIVDSQWPWQSQAYRGQKVAATVLGLEAGPPIRPKPPEPDPLSLKRAEKMLKELPGLGPRIGLTLQGLQPEKSWPLANFVLLCQWLWQEMKASMFITGGAGDARAAEVVIKASKVPVANFCGRTGLSDVISLAAKSDLFITIDTGTAHLAALTDTPLISIYTWTSPALWPPQTPNAKLMVYDWALRRFGLRFSDGPWVSTPVVTPEMVFKEAVDILQSRPGLSG